MNESQFKVLRSLYQSVDRVADAFGSEDTSSGLVIPVPHETLEAACHAFLPATWTVHPLGFDAFVSKYVKPTAEAAVHAFVELARHFPADAAYVAPPGFNREAHSRGVFQIVVFLDTLHAAGTRVLIAFERVET